MKVVSRLAFREDSTPTRPMLFFQLIRRTLSITENAGTYRQRARIMERLVELLHGRRLPLQRNRPTPLLTVGQLLFFVEILLQTTQDTGSHFSCLTSHLGSNTLSRRLAFSLLTPVRREKEYTIILL